MPAAALQGELRLAAAVQQGGDAECGVGAPAVADDGGLVADDAVVFDAGGDVACGPVCWGGFCR